MESFWSVFCGVGVVVLWVVGVMVVSALSREKRV